MRPRNSKSVRPVLVVDWGGQPLSPTNSGEKVLAIISAARDRVGKPNNSSSSRTISQAECASGQDRGALADATGVPAVQAKRWCARISFHTYVLNLDRKLHRQNVTR
jgi:hypothetical protein